MVRTDAPTGRTSTSGHARALTPDDVAAVTATDVATVGDRPRGDATAQR